MKKTNISRKIIIATSIIVPIAFFGMLFSTSAFAQQVTPEERARLEAELKQLEVEIAKKQAELNSQKGTSTGITKEITKLQNQIDKARLNVKAKNLEIIKLSSEISNKSSTISDLEGKLSNQKDSLSQLIRKTDELDDANMIHLILSGKDLSDFYSDVDSLSAIKKALRTTVMSVREIKESTESQKSELEQKQDAELDAKAALEQNKKQAETDEAYRKRLLSISKNKEKEYESILIQNRAKAAAIKARLFNFAGGQTAAIPFGTAVAHAELAQARTGVPAALVLAILTQESALGANVGKCYLKNATTGAGVGMNTGTPFVNVMKPTRDVPPFIQITQSMGMDPFKTVVSCPIAGVAGWGGAMGPAQFIASTWKLVSGRVAAITGSANPWNAKDAIVASATYLSDLGAGPAYSSQIKAACKYYGTGGVSCSYGTQVMARVAKIQADIDYLKQYGVSNR
jgi:peptidoglycan hydrolase CwlO-like protein